MVLPPQSTSRRARRRAARSARRAARRTPPRRPARPPARAVPEHALRLGDCRVRRPAPRGRRSAARSGTSACRRAAARASRRRCRRPARRPARPPPAPWCRVGARLRLDADDRHAPAVPGGDAADQPAAADRDEQRVEVRRLSCASSSAEGALAEQRLGLVVGVDRHARRCSRRTPRSRPARRRSGRRPRPGRRRSRGCVSALAGEATLGTKIVAGIAELLRGVGDRRAVVAARGRDHAAVGTSRGQQVGERAARLERAGVLQATRA